MGRLADLYSEAKQVMAGGVSAGQRYHKTLGQPLYIDHASGCRLYDVEGNEYIDFFGCAGAALFGYNHPRLKTAVEKAVEKGFFMNFDTEYHIELAKKFREFFPSAEKVRLANTGSEATQCAVRLARTYTGKDLIIKFDGHFHGMHEQVWYNHNMTANFDQYGEVVTTADSTGFASGSRDVVKTVLFNDIAALEHAAEKYRGNVAAIIMEPISFNCGCLTTRKEYLEKIRELCNREKIVLIFDEVISGLRMRPGSAQKFFGVTPDLTTVAKAIGGGFAIAALLGKSEIMDNLNPTGKMMMSGTYSGALMPVLASLECLKMAGEPAFYDHIDTIAAALYGGINDLFKKNGLPGHVRGQGARFGIYFGVENSEDDYDFRKIAQEMDRGLTQKFIAECLPNGLWFHDTAGPVSPAHYGFTIQHTMKDIEIALEKIDRIFAKIR